MINIFKRNKSLLIEDGGQCYAIKPPYFSLHNYRSLRGRSIIVGFIGPRGSGKSVGGARTIIMDYMLRGKNVWSNMDIGFRLVNNGSTCEMTSKPLDKLELVDLDKVYQNGVIYVDEVNLMAEARRAMSRENLMFSYILQELRKRRLSIIWSAQSEMHCDDRLRFQTDVFIMCQDMSITKPHCGVGELSLWKAFDYSGIVTGKPPKRKEDSIFFEGIIRNKPWWNTYNTWQVQTDANIVEGEEKTISEQRMRAIQIAAKIAEILNDNPELTKDEIWHQVGVSYSEEGLMKTVGQELRKGHGIKSVSRYRWKGEEVYA